MPDLPVYDVFAIRYGEQKERSEGTTFLGGDPNRMIPGLDFFTYAIVGGGRTWIVDTGFNADLSGEGGRMFLHDPVEVLFRLGIDAGTATDLLLTHAHFDHVGNLNAYPRARFRMHAEEMLSIAGPDMTYAPLRVAYHLRDTQALVGLLYGDRLVLDTAPVVEVAPGIESHLIGGHSRGQTVLRVHSRRGWILLASDAVHLYEEVTEERPFAIFHDLAVMVEGYRRCLALAGSLDRLVPGHDPRVSRQYPAPSPDLEGMVLDLGIAPSNIA